jgi:hypothetical protein
VKRLEVNVGGDKWRLSFSCLATWSVDSCLVYTRLWSRRGQGGCWEGGQGDCQLEVGRRAPGWDALYQMPWICVYHCCLVTVVFCGCYPAFQV